MEWDPPFEETYGSLLRNSEKGEKAMFSAQECDPPIIDLNCLKLGVSEKEECKRRICSAASDWGFFQVINHGIPAEVLKNMKQEEMQVFQQPFLIKAQHKCFNFPPNSYRWGNPNATCPTQISWSEAFHLPLKGISRLEQHSRLRETVEAFAATASELSHKLTEILAERLGAAATYFVENCPPSECYLRMNRYPPCPFSSEVFGIMPHTDSNFLTVLFQDEAGGLQILKDGSWFSIKPDPDFLLVIVGDLLEAWSNGVYRSLKHRVVASKKVDRFSVAHFLCPSYDATIESCTHTRPPIYRKFSFKEYREQVQQDVEATGDKVGLSRFVL